MGYSRSIPESFFEISVASVPQELLAAYPDSRTYPTNLIIDQNGTLVYCQDGGFENTEELTFILDSFLKDSNAGVPMTYYYVKVIDQNGNYVPDVELCFADGDDTQYVTTDTDGVASLLAPTSMARTVAFSKVPDGCSFNQDLVVPLSYVSSLITLQITRG